jgi:hypothetical protein
LHQQGIRNASHLPDGGRDAEFSLFVENDEDGGGLGDCIEEFEETLDELGLSGKWKSRRGKAQRQNRGSAYVGIRLVNQLLVALLGDDRGPDHDRDIGEASVGDVTEFVEDILAMTVRHTVKKKTKCAERQGT